MTRNSTGQGTRSWHVPSPDPDGRLYAGCPEGTWSFTANPNGQHQPSTFAKLVQRTPTKQALEMRRVHPVLLPQKKVEFKGEQVMILVNFHHVQSMTFIPMIFHLVLFLQRSVMQSAYAQALHILIFKNDTLFIIMTSIIAFVHGIQSKVTIMRRVHRQKV